MPLDPDWVSAMVHAGDGAVAEIRRSVSSDGRDIADDELDELDTAAYIEALEGAVREYAAGEWLRGIFGR